MLSAIRVVSSAYLRLLIFLPAILIPACDSSSPAFLMMYSAYKLSTVTTYSLDILLFQFGTSPLLANGLELDQSMSSSNCCFLTCIHISQEAGKVVWCSHLFQNFPQFIVIHTVKGFGIVNKAEIVVFLELSCFLYDPSDIEILISDSSAFSKSSLKIWKFMVHVLLKPGLSVTLLACEMSAIVR